MVNPDYWRSQNFLCEALDSFLPPAKKNALLKVLELEPVDSRYWAYLKPLDRGWYIDEFVVIGATVDGFDEGTIGSMQEAAKGMSAKCEFLAWRKVSMPFGLKKDSIDIALVSDGAIARLGSRLENAMRNTRRVMKDTGRFFFVANEEDERALGGPLEKDFSGASPVDKYGFEIQTTKREFGLAVGYMKKRQGGAVPSARSQTVSSGASGFSKATGRRSPRTPKRERLY